MEASKHEANTTLGLYAMAATGNAQKALSALQEEYKKWSKDGITEEELKDSKQSLRSTMENMWANDAYVVSSLCSNLELDRDFDFQAKLLKKIESLSVAQVKTALDKYVAPVGLAEVKAGDFKQ